MIKQLFNILFALVLLILSIPLILIFSVILIIELRSWPFFTQQRGLTLRNQRLKIYKLKTIRPREENISHTTEQDIFLKPGLKNKVTPFSGWLRKTGLDELPQLVNVIIGQMNLIGPRPLMLEDLETMKRISPSLYERRDMLRCKPGISGLWQLFGNRNEGMIGMIALESLYEKVASPLFDFKLILYTTTIVLQAKNSDSIFHLEKANPSRVKTFLDNSSNLKVTLNMPEGIAKFILDKVQKYEGKYTVKIPQDWWDVGNTNAEEKIEAQKPKILPIEITSKKTAS